MTSEKSASKAKNGKQFLVVVESPTKQKTIGRILGPQYTVKSSFGHVRDLPERDLGIDEKNNFKPTYVVIAKAKKNIAELKDAAKNAGLLFLATDPDREGESIAWHLAQVLALPPDKVKRITFHEITPSAVLHSLESARQVDISLVEAQQARRILDRLVGYKLSPLLWKKVGKGLSAGRVQSVAVRLLVERAKEMSEFKEEEFWSITAKLEKPQAQPVFSARLIEWRGQNVEKTATHKLFAEDYSVKTTIFRQAEDLAPINAVLRKGPLTVSRIESKDTKQKPRPPFITSSLQQDAYSKLGFSSQRTMKVAQSLYEGVALGAEEAVGLITYMRTDSFNVSKDIQEEARKFISSQYGAEFAPKNFPFYASKVKGAQEAHEAIHPTSVYRKPEEVKKYLTGEQAKLYDLIWRRFMASQMNEAVFHSISADIQAGLPAECVLRATGRSVKFSGYLKVYQEEESDEPSKADEAPLPAMAEGDGLNLLDVSAKSHKSSPPPAYNEASLIKILERHGIGRPSTYAPIIQTIVDRKYALRQPKTNRLLATSLGVTVTEKLKGFFPEIMDLTYTAGIEEKLDEIAEGHTQWVKVVQEFYAPFTKDLADAYKSMEAARPQPSDEKCPECGSPMLLRESRYGKYLSCSQFPKCKGKIRLDNEGNKVVLQQTGENCDICGKPMVIRTGRRGRFLACSGFPACKNTYSLDSEGKKIEGSRPVETDRKCEKCSRPLVLRHGRRGYFLACSGYPKCKNIVKASPEEIEKLTGKSGGAAPASGV